MNIGAFAGGVAKGISHGIDDRTKMDDAQFKKKERERQEEERRVYDDIVKQVAEADKARRKLSEQAKPSPQQAVAMGGITSMQQTPPAGEEFDQMVGGGNQAPTPPAARNNFIAAAAGITKPTDQLGYRDHAAEDKLAMVDDMYGRLLNKGLFSKAADIGQVRTALLGEKLQGETRQREAAARGVIAALDSGDDKAILEVSKEMSKLLPDGKELRSIKSLPDGRIEAVYGNDGDAPKIVTRDQLKQSAASLVDWRVALQVSQHAQQQEFEKLKHEDDKKNKSETLAEQKRHHIVKEGIERITANAAKTKAENNGGLTLPQMRTNAEIEAARKYVRGLGQEEIRRRTQQYSATGRENPDYDPLLAAKVRLSQHRKYGEDSDFADIAKPEADPMQDISERFSTDPAMKGHRLGNQTQHGFEVFDTSGKLIGHYN